MATNEKAVKKTVAKESVKAEAKVAAPAKTEVKAEAKAPAKKVATKTTAKKAPAKKATATKTATKKAATKTTAKKAKNTVVAEFEGFSIDITNILDEAKKAFVDKGHKAPEAKEIAVYVNQGGVYAVVNGESIGKIK